MKGEKPGLVVRAEDSCPRGRRFESRLIMDGCKRFASYYIKRKIENKGSQMGHTKKKKKKSFAKCDQINLNNQVQNNYCQSSILCQ
jgi:hypothetical protein